MVRESIITLALLHEFVYEFRGNNTCIIQDRTALSFNLILWVNFRAPKFVPVEKSDAKTRK